MSDSERLTWMLVAIVWTVGPMVVLGGGRHPLYVDVMAYAAVASGAAWTAAHICDRITARRERADAETEKGGDRR